MKNKFSLLLLLLLFCTIPLCSASAANTMKIKGPTQVAAGKKITLNVEMPGRKGEIHPVTWKSSRKSIATVNELTGKVKGIKAGTTTITATSMENMNLTATVTITVYPEPVKSISFKNVPSKMDVSGILAPSKQTVLIKTNDGAANCFSWKSSRPDILSVDSNGNLKALAPGKAKITVKALDGSGKSKSFDVKVKCAVQSIELSGDTNLISGQATTMSAKVTPSSASNKLSWKSSNTKMATVDSKGKVKVKADAPSGDVTITATAKDGSKTEGKIVLHIQGSASPIASAPEIISPKEGEVFSFEPLELNASWKEVKGASDYRVTLIYQDPYTKAYNEVYCLSFKDFQQSTIKDGIVSIRIDLVPVIEACAIIDETIFRLKVEAIGESTSERIVSFTRQGLYSY